MVDGKNRPGRRLKLTPEGRRTGPEHTHAEVDGLLPPDGAGRLRLALQALS